MFLRNSQHIDYQLFTFLDIHFHPLFYFTPFDLLKSLNIFVDG